MGAGSIAASGGLPDGKYRSFVQSVDGRPFQTATYSDRLDTCTIELHQEADRATVRIQSSIPLSIEFDVPVRISGGGDEFDTARIPPGKYTLEVERVEE